MKSIQTKLTVRKIRHQEVDEIGQIGTFTVDETGKQNSPTFINYSALWDWANEPWNFSFKAEMKASN